MTMEHSDQSRKRYPTDEVIEAITRLCMRDAPDEERQLYKQALHSLVKMAKTELLLEMQTDFNKCTGVKLQG